MKQQSVKSPASKPVMFTYSFAYANPPGYTGVATNMNIEAVIHSEMFDDNPNIDIITPDKDDKIIKIFIKFWIDTQLTVL